MNDPQQLELLAQWVAPYRDGIEALEALDGAAALRALDRASDAATHDCDLHRIDRARAVARLLVARGLGPPPRACAELHAQRRAWREVEDALCEGRWETADEPVRRLGRAWRIAMAEALEQAAPDHRLADLPAAQWWREAGALERALASAAITQAAHPRDGLLMVLRANCLFRLDRHEEARELYARALLIEPESIALSRIEDPEVRLLQDVAEDDFELAGDARPWLPVVGFLEGVLPLVAFVPERGDGDQLSLFGDVGPARPAAAFYRALFAAERSTSGSAEDVLRHRVEMKRLHPGLFRGYLSCRR